MISGITKLRSFRSGAVATLIVAQEASLTLPDLSGNAQVVVPQDALRVLRGRAHSDDVVHVGDHHFGSHVTQLELSALPSR